MTLRATACDGCESIAMKIVIRVSERGDARKQGCRSGRPALAMRSERTTCSGSADQKADEGKQRAEDG